MVQTRRSTLADVAARAGVSVTTASYVLNGRTTQMRISDTAAKRVRRAATDLAYRPNRSARNLRMSSSATIGVISRHVASGLYASQMLSGAAAIASETGRLLMIGETEADKMIESRLILEMIDRQVDGILLATLAASRIAVPRELDGVPVVLLNCVDKAGKIPGVVPDDEAGGRTAVEALFAHGDPGTVWVVGEDPTRDATAGPLRMRGIEAELAQQGSALAGVIPCPWDVESAYSAVSRWLGDGSSRPAVDALICLNDRVAMGTYQALADQGLVVPDDVSVVSFDGSQLADWLRPSVTSVALPFVELGRRAAKLLLDPAREHSGNVLVPMHLSHGTSIREA